MNATIAVTPWYSSGTFWAAAGVAATLIAMAVGALVLWQVNFPRRRLTYSLLTANPILTAPDEVNTDFEVSHRGVLVGNPYVVEVRLTAGGRLDIPSTAFDSGRPLRLLFTVPVVAVLRTDIMPDGVSIPSLEVSGSVLAIQPCRIDRRQTTTITLIVDGPPDLVCESPLIDVEVTDAAARDASRRRTARALRVGSLVLGAATGIVWSVWPSAVFVLAILLVLLMAWWSSIVQP